MLLLFRVLHQYESDRLGNQLVQFLSAFRVAFCLGRKCVHQQAPATFLGTDTLLYLVAHFAIPVEVLMLKHNARFVGRERFERNFDFGHEIGIILIIMCELPRHCNSSRRVPGNDLAPVALRTIHVLLIPSTIEFWLKDGFLHVRFSDVVSLWPPGIKPLGEDTKRMFLWRFDHDLFVDRIGIVHSNAPFFYFSAAILKFCNARSHILSRYSRMVSMPFGSIE